MNLPSNINPFCLIDRVSHLYRSEIRRAHKQVDQVCPSGLMVEEDKQRPVQQPGTLLELNQGDRECLVVDGLLNLVDVIARSLEVLDEKTSISVHHSLKIMMRYLL